MSKSLLFPFETLAAGLALAMGIATGSLPTTGNGTVHDVAGRLQTVANNATASGFVDQRVGLPGQYRIVGLVNELVVAEINVNGRMRVVGQARTNNAGQFTITGLPANTSLRIRTARKFLFTNGFQYLMWYGSASPSVSGISLIYYPPR